MNCECCPPSVAGTTLTVHNWLYIVSDDGDLWVNFYNSNTLSTKLADVHHLEFQFETHSVARGATDRCVGSGAC